MSTLFAVPVAKPRLPPLAALAPYIDRIDSARWYSNFGPLCEEFEARLAQRFHLGPGQLTTVSNATVGLALALRASGARPGALCLVPSWTFSASVHAVLEAGLAPFFTDVNEAGVLTPEIARQALTQAHGDVVAVMPVGLYGQPLDPQEWDQFAEETGLTVVIDAAPGFDAARPGRSMSVVSLHATKVLGVGEGGFVMSTQAEGIAGVRQRSNFGFEGSREAGTPGTNGKLSEYACAVGLAGMDDWTARREAFGQVATFYHEALADLAEVTLPQGWGEAWQSTTCIVQFARPAPSLAGALRAAGIETRDWWGRGMHLHRAFSAFLRLPLPNTDHLAATTLGLPFFIDMTKDEVGRVCRALRDELGRRP